MKNKIIYLFLIGFISFTLQASPFDHQSDKTNTKTAILGLQGKAGIELGDDIIDRITNRFVRYHTLKEKKVHVVWRLLASMMAINNAEATKLHDKIVCSGYERDNNLLQAIGCQWGNQLMNESEKGILNTRFALACVEAKQNQSQASSYFHWLPPRYVTTSLLAQVMQWQAPLVFTFEIGLNNWLYGDKSNHPNLGWITPSQSEMYVSKAMEALCDGSPQKPENPPDSSPSASSPSTDNYTIEMAEQDVRFQLNRFRWSKREPIEALRLTLLQWSQLCPKKSRPFFEFLGFEAKDFLQMEPNKQKEHLKYKMKSVSKKQTTSHEEAFLHCHLGPVQPGSFNHTDFFRKILFAISDERCAIGEFNEPECNKLCEKAFGTFPGQEGIINTHALKLLWKNLTEKGFKGDVVQHLNWLIKNVNHEEPDLKDFMIGIDFNFASSRCVLKQRFDAASLSIKALNEELKRKPSPGVLSKQEALGHAVVAFHTAKQNTTKTANTGYHLWQASQGGIAWATFQIAMNTTDSDKRIELLRKAGKKGFEPAWLTLVDALQEAINNVFNSSQNNLLKEEITREHREEIKELKKKLNYPDSLVLADLLFQKQNPEEQNKQVRNLRFSIRKFNRPYFCTLLGGMILNGTTSQDEYGETFSEEERIEVAHKLFEKAIQNTPKVVAELASLYVNIYNSTVGCIAQTTRGEQSVSDEDRNNLLVYLYQKLAQKGCPNALTWLAKKLQTGVLQSNEQGQLILAKNRVSESLRMYAQANIPNAWFAWATLRLDQETSPQANLKALYEEIVSKIKTMPDRKDKIRTLFYAAWKCKQAKDMDIYLQQARSQMSFSEWIDLQFLSTNSPFPDEEQTDQQAISSSDEDVEKSSDDNSEDPLPAKPHKPSQHTLYLATSHNAYQKEKVNYKQRAQEQKAKREKVKQEIREAKYAYRTRCEKAFQPKTYQNFETEVIFSKDAERDYDHLTPGQKAKLSLLLEDAKKPLARRKHDEEQPQHAHSTCLKFCKHEKTADGQTIWYGYLSKKDRLEFTCEEEDNQVKLIHVLGVSGHHTAATGKKRTEKG